MPDVAVMLDTNARALDRARQDQEKALAAGGRIDKLSFASLAFMPSLSGSGRHTCSLEEVHQFLERRRVAEEDLRFKLQAAMGLNAALAFQAWTLEATPDDAWPFSIQADGRPLDFVAALTLDKLTGEVEWLTLREFGNCAGDAAARAKNEATHREMRDDESIKEGKPNSGDDGRL